MILTRLASSVESETGFTELRDSLGFTSGNLSVQLRTLEDAGYIKTEKRFVGRKPYTGISLTVAGAKALEMYATELESLIASLRKKN